MPLSDRDSKQEPARPNQQDQPVNRPLPIWRGDPDPGDVDDFALKTRDRRHS